MQTPSLPADRLALLAQIDANAIRDRLAAERVPATLAADIAALRAAREVLLRRRVASHAMTLLDREADNQAEQLAELSHD